jgi:putative addiction module component (TIGR02574 family)
MGIDMNKAALRKELMELSPGERLDLIGELWDSIPPEETPALSEELRREIERRYEALVNDPTRGSTWEAARERLWAKYK